MKIFGRIRASADSWYLPVMLSTWCFAPGLRRIVDWEIGRTPFNIISITPLLALLALGLFVYRNAASPNVRLPFKAISYLWLFGFVYAFVVAVASGGRASAVYDFAEFCLPVLVGAWLIMRPTSREKAFGQFATTLLWLAVVECVYGLYQFVAPPPWDVKYVTELHQVSLGIPEPFGLHPFAMLNGHGIMAVFLTIVVLVNLYRLDLRRPFPLLVTILSIGVLILTNVRSAWLALIVGIVTYLILSPRRGRAVGALTVVGLVSLLLLFNASTIFGNAGVTTQLQARIATLANPDADASVNGRREETYFALHQGMAEPLGQGLGTVGTAVWLSGNQSDAKVAQLVLDNGYIARFLEMGLPGLIFYVATLIFGLIFGIRAYAMSVSTGNKQLQTVAVAGLSVQVALVGLDLSSDFHDALSGVFFWIAVGLALRFEPSDEGVRPAWDTVDTKVARAKGPLWV